MVRVSRGLTLIEILVALGIVVALAALVLPTLSWMSRFRPLDTASEDVQALYLRARAHAAVNGRPVQITLSRFDLEADWFEVETLSFDDSDVPSDVDADESKTAFPLATWSRLGLLDDVRYQPRSRFLSESSEEASSWSGSDVRDPAFDDPADSAVLLTILLPDGTAISRERLVLSDDMGRIRSILIDELTGRVIITESDAMTSGNEGSSSESEAVPLRDPTESIPDDLTVSDGRVGS